MDSMTSGRSERLSSTSGFRAVQYFRLMTNKAASPKHIHKRMASVLIIAALIVVGVVAAIVYLPYIPQQIDSHDQLLRMFDSLERTVALSGMERTDEVAVKMHITLCNNRDQPERKGKELLAALAEEMNSFTGYAINEPDDRLIARIDKMREMVRSDTSMQ